MHAHMHIYACTYTQPHRGIHRHTHPIIIMTMMKIQLKQSDITRVMHFVDEKCMDKF